MIIIITTIIIIIVVVVNPTITRLKNIGLPLFVIDEGEQGQRQEGTKRALPFSSETPTYI